MAFVDQVQDITSLTVSDTDELSQFLKDGAIDVTSKWLATKPQDIELFARESAETTSNASLDLSGAKIISVIRENGTNNQWRNCRKISPALQYDVTNEDSLAYASKFNPAYMIGDNGKISVFPTPGSNPDAFKAYYVNNSPEESDGSALRYTSTNIKYFPDDKVYLVIIYAGMKLLQATMGATTISDLTINSVPPVAPAAPSFSATSVGAVTVGSLGTAPTYSKPTLVTRSSFNDFFESGSLNPLDDSDPGVLTITVSAPVAPALTTITFSSLDSSIDANMNAVVVGGTLGSSTLPTYSKPTQTFDITQFETFLETNEDTELAQVQMGRLQHELGEFQADIQNELNEFNKENVAYQSSVQEAMAEFQQQNQMNITNAERSQNRQLQYSINDMKVIYDNNAQAIQKYGSDLQKYQQEVASQVQEYTQKFTRYSTELNTVFQAWGKTESDNLQQYTADIQNELNEFNKENVAYQSTIQEALKEFDSEAAREQKDADFTQQTKIQEYASKVQKYQADLAVYQGKVGTQVQEYTQNLQADGTGYQWLQGQYTSLKADYDKAFSIAAPKPPPQGR